MDRMDKLVSFIIGLTIITLLATIILGCVFITHLILFGPTL